MSSYASYGPGAAAPLEIQTKPHIEVTSRFPSPSILDGKVALNTAALLPSERAMTASVQVTLSFKATDGLTHTTSLHVSTAYILNGKLTWNFRFPDSTFVPPHGLDSRSVVVHARAKLANNALVDAVPQKTTFLYRRV